MNNPSYQEKLREAFTKANGQGSHACYCVRATDGGCECAIKDEYVEKTIQAIEAIIKDEVERASIKLLNSITIGGRGTELFIQNIPLDNYIAQLQSKEKSDE